MLICKLNLIKVNLIKDLDFYYVLLIFSVNTHELFLSKIKKELQLLMLFNRKPSKIWENKGSEFYNRSMKSWLEKSDAEMYSAHNEGKSFVAERSIRTLKNKIYKYMSSVSKNVCIDR